MKENLSFLNYDLGILAENLLISLRCGSRVELNSIVKYQKSLTKIDK